MPRPILLCLSLCLLLLLPTWGDAPDESPLGACYMGYGKMLEAARSRQLSLNAHVEKFLYQPGGLGIAYQGSEKEDDTVTQFIRLAGVKRGTTTTLVATTSHVGDDFGQNDGDEPSYSLAGWSGDGRYLLLDQQKFVTTPDNANNYFSEKFDCVDVGLVPPRIVPIPLPEPDPMDNTVWVRDTRHWWSPNRLRLLFALQGRPVHGEDRFLRSIFANTYDPKTGSVQNVVLGERQVVRGWLDDGHLLLDDSQNFSEYQTSPKVHYAAYDVATGTQTIIPPPKRMPDLAGDASSAPQLISPKASYMTLDDEVHQIRDQQKVGVVDAHTLWVRRTQGPRFQSAAPVGLTPGADDTQAAWSPTGAQIAFVAHGDLFVTDLTMREATPGEKYAAGEKLTCPEERDLAANNLKQVGLAIFQYTQDYDETFPPGDKWQDRVMPYLKNASYFSPAGHPVVYRVPLGMTVASLDSPQDTVLGYVELPCATVTLYADGHVKALPKEATEGLRGAR